MEELLDYFYSSLNQNHFIYLNVNLLLFHSFSRQVNSRIQARAAAGIVEGVGKKKRQLENDVLEPKVRNRDESLQEEKKEKKEKKSKKEKSDKKDKKEKKDKKDGKQ